MILEEPETGGQLPFSGATIEQESTPVRPNFQIDDPTQLRHIGLCQARGIELRVPGLCRLSTLCRVDTSSRQGAGRDWHALGRPRPRAQVIYAEPPCAEGPARRSPDPAGRGRGRQAAPARTGRLGEGRAARGIASPPRRRTAEAHRDRRPIVRASHRAAPPRPQPSCSCPWRSAHSSDARRPRRPCAACKAREG